MANAVINFNAPGMGVISSGTSYNLGVVGDAVTIAWNAPDAAAKTMTIPSPGFEIVNNIIRIADKYGNAGTYNITISIFGGIGTINGGSSVVISTNGGCVVLQNDGTGNYVLISNAGTGSSGSTTIRNITGSTTTDTASASDGTINWLSSQATKTQNIPGASAANKGHMYVIKDGNYTAQLADPINITPASGTIEQNSTLALNVAGAWAMIQSDGISNWIQIG